jgi:hypothetical protein
MRAKPAWRGIGAEAVGKRRVLKTQLRVDAERRMRTLRSVELVRQTPRLLTFRYFTAELSWIEAGQEDPGAEQDCVAGNFLLLGQLANPESGAVKPGIALGPWCLEALDHSTGRLFQRHRKLTTDGAIAVLHRAADALLAIGGDRFGFDRGDEFFLPIALVDGLGAGGSFVVELVNSHDRTDGSPMLVHGRARTWFSADMEHALPIAMPAEPGTPSLGASFMLPRPLRRLIETTGPDGQRQLAVEPVSSALMPAALVA